MKAVLTITLLLSSLSGFSALAAPTPTKDFKFVFKSGTQSFEIKKKAASQESAFKLAAKECYSTLTGGTYPGEERGMDIIDICANPKM